MRVDGGRVDALRAHRSEQREDDEQHDVTEEQDLRHDRCREVVVHHAEDATGDREKEEYKRPLQHDVLAGTRRLH